MRETLQREPEDGTMMKFLRNIALLRIVQRALRRRR